MMDWLRLYNEMPGDPKLRGIARYVRRPIAEVIAAWVVVLTKGNAAQPRGYVGDLTGMDIAEYLDVEVEVGEALMDGFRWRGMIDPETGEIAAFSKRNPKREDDSRERVRAYRERKRNESPSPSGGGNGRNASTENETETSRDVTQRNADVTPRENQTEQKDYNPPSPNGDSPPLPGGASADEPDPDVPRFDPSQEMLDIWNRQCVGLQSRPCKMTADRKTKFRRRFEEQFDKNLTLWADFCKMIAASDFLAGRVSRWKATIDWALQPKNALKVLEGNYDNRSSASPAEPHLRVVAGGHRYEPPSFADALAATRPRRRD